MSAAIKSVDDLLRTQAEIDALLETVFDFDDQAARARACVELESRTGVRFSLFARDYCDEDGDFGWFFS